MKFNVLRKWEDPRPCNYLKIAFNYLKRDFIALYQSINQSILYFVKWNLHIDIDSNTNLRISNKFEHIIFMMIKLHNPIFYCIYCVIIFKNSIHKRLPMLWSFRLLWPWIWRGAGFFSNTLLALIAIKKRKVAQHVQSPILFIMYQSQQFEHNNFGAHSFECNIYGL